MELETNLQAVTPAHKLLLVEDSRDSADRLRYLLRSLNLNLNVKCVASAESAIEELEDGEFDFVIADHFLKGQLTGLDLWRLCRYNGKLQPFLLTSSLTRQDFQSLIETDRQSPLFLSKNLDPSASLKTLEKFVTTYVELDTPKALALTENKWTGPELRASLLGFLFLFLLIPVHMSAPLPDVREFLKTKEMNILLQLPTDIPARPQRTVPRRAWRTSDIITPDLKQKIQIILER